MKWFVVTFIVCLLASPSIAQHERYELGRRLRAFEAAWEEQKDPAIRKRALIDLPKLTNQFFSLQFGEAGRTLETASAILLKEPTTGDGCWSRSLYATVPVKIIDADRGSIEITIKPFYKAKEPAPAAFAFESRYANQTPAGSNHTIEKLPYLFSFPLSSMADAADDAIREETIVTAANDVSLSRVKQLERRLNALKEAVGKLPTPLTTIEQATLKDEVEFLAEAADGMIPESDIRFGERLRVAERLAKGIESFRPRAKAWDKSVVSFPTGVKRGTTATRVFVPPETKLTRPVPIVLGLHGAGGSENLFVEGYGAGRIVEECRTRGWILISPRSPGFAASAPVLSIVDQLAERFPIDKSKIFLVGHSMGAGQAIELCQKHPGKFAGVAALGGGGRVRNAKVFTDLPTFIGVGTKDFALSGSRSLKKTLADGGAKQLTYREYPDFEHLVIVREALPDVFAMFDDAVKAKPAVRP